MTPSPSSRCFNEVVHIPLTVNTPVSRQPDSLSLDQYFVLEQVWRGQSSKRGIYRVGPEEAPQHAGEQLRHPVLLLPGAVVLDGQDQRVGGGGEGVGLDGVSQDVLEEELGGERPAVVNDRLAVSSVPTVQL